jgi:hypothetical protein
LTERFRVQARELALERAYSYIAGLHREVGDEDGGIRR